MPDYSEDFTLRMQARAAEHAAAQARLEAHNRAYEAGWAENCRRLDALLIVSGYAAWVPDDSPFARDPRVVRAKQVDDARRKQRDRQQGRRPRTPLPIPRTLRFTILKRDSYRCRLCGAAPRDGRQVELEVDHITSRAAGGTNDPMNLWTLCIDCNRGKGTQSL